MCYIDNEVNYRVVSFRRDLGMMIYRCVFKGILYFYE